MGRSVWRPGFQSSFPLSWAPNTCASVGRGGRLGRDACSGGGRLAPYCGAAL
jgi:hypothetical protein